MLNQRVPSYISILFDYLEKYFNIEKKCVLNSRSISVFNILGLGGP